MLLVSAGTVEESRVSDIVRRTLQAASALDDLSTAPVDEQTVAAHVLGDVPLPRAPRLTAPSPRTPAATDLQALAAAEAARVLVVRQLRGRSSCQPHSRAFAARFRNRMPAAVGALRVEVADSDGQLVWETIAGVTGEWRSNACSAAETRALVHLWWDSVRSHVASDAALAGILSLDSIRTVASLGLKREAALADDIERRRARLAAGLVQGGLFDRRAERDAQSRRELLDLVLSRFGERKAALERLARTTVTVRPAFVLIPW